MPLFLEKSLIRQELFFCGPAVPGWWGSRENERFCWSPHGVQEGKIPPPPTLQAVGYLQPPLCACFIIIYFQQMPRDTSPNRVTLTVLCSQRGGEEQHPARRSSPCPCRGAQAGWAAHSKARPVQPRSPTVLPRTRVGLPPAGPGHCSQWGGRLPRSPRPRRGYCWVASRGGGAGRAVGAAPLPVLPLSFSPREFTQQCFGAGAFPPVFPGGEGKGELFSLALSLLAVYFVSLFSSFSSSSPAIFV